MNTKTHSNDIKELSFAFVELQKFNKKEHELVSDEDKWIYFIKEIGDQSEVPVSLAHEEFNEACHIAERMKWSEYELNAYDDAFVRATDDSTSLELAMEKGLKHGLEKGKKEGLEKGKKEGLEKGKKEAKIEIVRTMLANKMSVDVVASVTGLTVNEIKKIKKDNN